MPTFVVIFSRHELKFQQLSQTLISRPLNCYLQLCKSKMPNFLLMSQTGVWVRSLPSSAMTSKRSSSSESLATFKLAKLSSFEQLHPPYGLPSLHFLFKQQCHIRRKRCCHVASWLDVIRGKQPAPLDFSDTQILCTATCSSSCWTSARAVKAQLFDCV